MKRLGISIYPEKSNKDELYAYMKKAAECGFSRIFSCLLSVTEDKETIKNDFREMNRYAHELGFEVILDVSPRVFDDLDISYNDLTFFHEVECDGIRLDMGFTGMEESLMTFNEYGLKIEINMSRDVHYPELIMDYMPDTNMLIGCHNFYPHNYSGLGLDFFNSCTDRFRKFGLQTAAFVTSQTPNSFGPWPVTDGLPTLEMHRHMPLHLQVKHYIAMGTIDDVIISNCYASDEELERVGKLAKNLITFDVDLVDDLPEVETSIVLDELHFNRGDVSENFLRSTQSRVKYKGHQFNIINPAETIRRGDVIIESSEYGHYAGELQIALHDMKNSGKSSVVGHIKDEELFLLDYMHPWQKFRFSRA